MAAPDDGLTDFLDGPSRPKTPPRRFSLLNVILVIGAIGLLIGLLLPARRTAGEAGRRTQCLNNLRQIALALIQYQSVYKTLPPAYTVDAAGRPLHSWRTLILPYLDGQSVYEMIDLSKPWDDLTNAKARASAFSSYQCPNLDSSPGHTTFLAIVSPDSCFPPGGSRRLSEITDRHDTTLMVIEADPDHSVHWMEPRDVNETWFMGINQESRLNHPGGTNAAFTSGAAQFLSAGLKPEARRAMVTISGNDDGVFPTDLSTRDR